MNIENKASDYIQDTDFFDEVKENIESPEKRPFKIFEFLRTKTGEGSIDSYKEHPLNFNNSNGIGQIIRGFSGILGDLDIAIIDIMLGFLKVFNDKKNVNTNV